MPPAPPQGILVAGGDPDGDDDTSGSLSHNTELSEEQEPKGWIARPITRDAAQWCHFHDALDTLLRRAFAEFCRCNSLSFYILHEVNKVFCYDAFAKGLEASCL